MKTQITVRPDSALLFSFAVITTSASTKLFCATGRTIVATTLTKMRPFATTELVKRENLLVIMDIAFGQFIDVMAMMIVATVAMRARPFVKISPAPRGDSSVAVRECVFLKNGNVMVKTTVETARMKIPNCVQVGESISQQFLLV